VLVSCPCRGRKEADSVIPALSVCKGFGPDIDGRTLSEVMIEGVVYNYLLRRIV
jgi:hypothetical protein